MKNGTSIIKQIIKHLTAVRKFLTIKSKSKERKRTKRIRRKIVLIVISSIIIAGFLIILLLSPIAKYLIEKYDEEYTGRKITTGWVYINPFTGYVHIGNLKVYESKSNNALVEEDSVFFAAKGISINFALHQLFFKTIEISEFTITRPKGTIVQNKKDFNFNDLIKKFTPEVNDTIPSKFHFNILNIKIINGEFSYREKLIPIHYSIKEVNFDSKGKRKDTDTVTATFSFLPEIGSGNVKFDVSYNAKNMDYCIDIFIHQLDLNILEQYFKDIANYGNLTANIDAEIKSKGNFLKTGHVTNTGNFTIHDFHCGKTPDDDYVSFDKLFIAIHEVSPNKPTYFYDSILVIHPFFKYEKYDYLDNLQMMFGKDMANIKAAKADQDRFNLIIEIADFVKELGRNFRKSNYRIDKLALENGVFEYNDYSLSEKFSITANPVSFIADSVLKSNPTIDAFLKSGIEPHGKISVNISLIPKDSGDFDMDYHLQGLPASLFNPYLINYTSFPLKRGTIEIKGKWNVRNSILKSDNNFLVTNLQTSQRIRNNDTKWIPLPIILQFVRERGNVIDYEIPITGNLSNPEFRLKDAITDLLGNIFIKSPASVYKKRVKHIKNESEESFTLLWEMHQYSLMHDQKKFIKEMAEFLEHNPTASIVVYPVHYAEKEKEYIRFFEAKKKYFLSGEGKNTTSFSEKDSQIVNKMSVKDSLFVHYLNTQVSNPMLFTIEDKCDRLIGSATINAKFEQLNNKRESAFLFPFIEKKVENRVKISKGEHNIPYNGFSYYVIEFNGEFPQNLVKTYLQMIE